MSVVFIIPLTSRQLHIGLIRLEFISWHKWEDLRLRYDCVSICFGSFQLIGGSTRAMSAGNIEKPSDGVSRQFS